MNFPRIDEAKITDNNHFGSKGENPDGYADLKNSLQLLKKSVPQDNVWAYDADGFAQEFQEILVKLGVDEDDTGWPDEDILLDAGFDRVDFRGDTRYLMKPNVPNVVVVVDENPDGAAALVVVCE